MSRDVCVAREGEKVILRPRCRRGRREGGKACSAAATHLFIELCVGVLRGVGGGGGGRRRSATAVVVDGDGLDGKGA